LKCFVSRDTVLLTRAFCTFVRPILEFSSIIWSPYYENEIVKIEAVQRSFTKTIANLRLCSYRERLLNLQLDSLQCRRIKADLITCHKILNGLVDSDIASAFGYSPYNFTRGNSLKLAKLHSSYTERDKYFFTNRIVNIWNSLPDSIVLSSSVSSFKRNVRRFDFSHIVMF
jgi:hypothetical protein